MSQRQGCASHKSTHFQKIPPKQVKYLATPSSIFIFISSSSTGELCSQPVRGNVRRTGRMFPEHVERSFSDPEYSFVAVGRILRTIFAKQKVRPIKNQLYSSNTPNYVREQMFAQLRTGLSKGQSGLATF